MQDRYTGDIGDYVKYALLRALGCDHQIGVAWYRYPDEAHNTDGRHVSYLHQPKQWESFDHELYAGLQDVVAAGGRSVAAIEDSGLIPDAVFSNELLACNETSAPRRAAWRRSWFDRVKDDLKESSLVFADPDNGLCPDDRFHWGGTKSWKRLPLSEAISLSAGRTAVIYHHNSRYPGGHRLEIDRWMKALPGCSIALYWRRFSNRTFFVTNPDPRTVHSLHWFAARWEIGCELIERPAET
ncbi:MAG: hypothetical protein KDA64_17100 [Rhodospirillaceae bacterium]|nr:hypothetical protein [Rhodospirillaceae bacterium]